MKKNDSVLIGSILYHLVPFQVGLRETFLCGAAAISVNAKSALHCAEPAVPPVLRVPSSSFWQPDVCIQDRTLKQSKALTSFLKGLAL